MRKEDAVSILILLSIIIGNLSFAVHLYNDQMIKESLCVSK